MTTAFLAGGLTFEIPAGWRLEPEPHVSACRSCRAPVMWATNEQSGKRMPFDPASDRLTPPISVSHFATCPDAQKWRR